jgi:hypothetical protein
LASAGLGLDYTIGQNLAANLTGAVALTDAGAWLGTDRTRAGDWVLNASLRIAFWCRRRGQRFGCVAASKGPKGATL